MITSASSDNYFFFPDMVRDPDTVEVRYPYNATECERLFAVFLPSHNWYPLRLPDAGVEGTALIPFHYR